MFGMGYSDTSTRSNESVFNRMGRLMGLRGSEPPAEPQQADAKPAAKPKPVAAARTAPPVPARAPTPPPKAPTQDAAADDPPAKPALGAVTQAQGTAVPPPVRPSSNASLLTGAQPVVSSSSFDSRWGALR
jgi:hypothetical protein